MTMTLTTFVAGGLELVIRSLCSPTATVRLKIGEGPSDCPLSKTASHAGKQMIESCPCSLPDPPAAPAARRVDRGLGAGAAAREAPVGVGTGVASATGTTVEGAAGAAAGGEGGGDVGGVETAIATAKALRADPNGPVPDTEPTPG